MKFKAGWMWLETTARMKIFRSVEVLISHVSFLIKQKSRIICGSFIIGKKRLH